MGGVRGGPRQTYELTPEEVEKKAEVLALMKKHCKTNYKFNGLEITVIPGEEKVKVRIKSDGVGNFRGFVKRPDAAQTTKAPLWSFRSYMSSRLWQCTLRRNPGKVRLWQPLASRRP
jgi:hypothetical protein